MRSNRPDSTASLTLDALPAPAALLDGERRIVHANKALRRLAGGRGALVGAGLHEVLAKAGGRVTGEATFRFLHETGARYLRLDAQPHAGGSLALLVDVSAEHAA